MCLLSSASEIEMGGDGQQALQRMILAVNPVNIFSARDFSPGLSVALTSLG
jgi:hypothetical protein